MINFSYLKTKTKLTSSVTKTLNYSYDAAGNRLTIKHPDITNTTFTYAYDQSSRMVSVKQGTSSLAVYAYDGASRRTSLTLGNGGLTPAERTVTYGYEPDGALDKLDHQLSGAANDVVWSFDYNRANQLTKRTLSNPLYQYLPPAAKAETYAANGLNQYTTVVKNGTPFALSYDANGNLTSDGIWTYSYDVENRLKTATNGVTTASYAYDPLGRRVSKTVNGTATLYLSDGVEEILEYNGGGSIVQRRYVFGPGVDEPVVLYAGATLLATLQHYYRADAQGSIVATTDNSGALRDTFKYGPYGEPSNPAGQPIQYTGRRWDPETGLYYYRARYYSPALGRFLQTDPVGYGDNTNLYSYVANDPVNNTDPHGAACLAVLRNLDSPFCQRSKLYGQLAANQKISARTNFFAAASIVTAALANKDAPFDNTFLSNGTNKFLNMVSASLEKVNIKIAGAIASGKLFSSGSKEGNDRLLVHAEQSIVQNALDTLRGQDLDQFNKVTGEINRDLNNPGALVGKVDSLFVNVLREVRSKLGGDIDFANQEHRELIGNTLTDEIRDSCLRGSLQKFSC